MGRQHERMHRLIVLALLASCAPSTYAWTPSSGRPVSPKPDNCKVDVMGSQPTRGYEEVGTLTHYNGPVPKTTDDLRKAVSKQVCQAGADAVIGVANDKGEFTKATVIKYAGDMAVPLKPAVDTPPPQASDTEIPH